MNDWVLPDYPHLRWSELQQKARPSWGLRFSRPAPVPEHLRPNAILCARHIHRPLRLHLGKPVHVASAYRSWEYHEALYRKYGKKVPRGSRHLTMEALDLKASGMGGEELKTLLLDLRARGIVQFGGIGLYPSMPSMVHVDIHWLDKDRPPTEWG